MGQKHRNLLEKITSTENLRDAYIKTKSRKRYNHSHLVFKENLEYNLLLVKKELENRSYELGKPYHFVVFEPKRRDIQALPFKDRLVQHAINNIINPIFEDIFYSCSYACRSNKGTHKAVKEVQATIRKLSANGEVYCLKMDFSKYFKSINKTILLKELRRKISDEETIQLLCKFIDKQGIVVGNLLSQLFANIYGHIFDRFIKTELKVKNYYRYMDDTVILSNNKEELILLRIKLEEFIKLEMKLNFSKWFILKVESKSVNFLGYRIRKNYKLIRKDSVIRAKRKIKKYKKTNDQEALRKFLASWKGHLKISDGYNLKNFIEKEIINYGK